MISTIWGDSKEAGEGGVGGRRMPMVENFFCLVEVVCFHLEVIFVNIGEERCESGK